MCWGLREYVVFFSDGGWELEVKFCGFRKGEGGMDGKKEKVKIELWCFCRR